MASQPGLGISDRFIEYMLDGAMYGASRGRLQNAYGVHSAWPFMSPKYAKHKAGRNHEFEDTMARMFIQVPPDLYTKFLASLEDPETEKIAKILTGDDIKQGGVGYLDFFLQNATHSFNEKVQVVETLSDSYVAFFFGHSAPIFSYQGTLMNTYQDDWTMRMFRIFRDLGRGTQLAKRGFVLRLRYDSMIVSGAMVNFQWSLQAGQEIACPFSFNLLVKNIQIIYGGLAQPTDLINEKHFAPEGFHLEDTGQTNNPASQTYLGSPPGSPEGVSEATSEGEIGAGGVDIDTDIDATGTYYEDPDRDED